jgi:DNA polymerase-3 subunit delta'
MTPLGRLLHEWTQNPLHVFRWPKRPSIATEWVLEIKREASRETFEGRSKVIILSTVEGMGIEAANRILKMLEEPGPHTVFVLTSSRLHQVVPTIRSRCQRVAFGEVPADDVAQLLQSEAGIAAKEAKSLAALSGGSVSRALTILEEGILETRGWTLGLMTLDRPALLDRLSTDVLGNPRRWDAGRVRHVAEVLMTWYRDVLTVKHGLPDTRVANRDHGAVLEAQAATADATEVRRCVQRVEGLIDAVEHQVTPSLALYATLAEILIGPDAVPVP